MNKTLKIISDSKLTKVPIKDNSEPLVYINDFVQKVIIRVPKYIEDEGKRFVKEASMVRIGVAKKMIMVEKSLPFGHKLFLRSAFRSLAIQKKTYQKTFNKIRDANPEWKIDEIKKEVSKFVAPLDIVPPHSTGGAIDISIIGPDNRQLDMGTRMGQDTNLEKTRTDSDKVSPTAMKNRKLLVKIMTTAGFVNYPTEWWHWSYGDRYWAAKLKKKKSIYKSV